MLVIMIYILRHAFVNKERLGWNGFILITIHKISEKFYTSNIELKILITLI